ASGCPGRPGTALARPAAWPARLAVAPAVRLARVAQLQADRAQAARLVQLQAEQARQQAAQAQYQACLDNRSRLQKLAGMAGMEDSCPAR
ncbi:MAG: hypothetical protein EON54_27930, partial [Alcaligenaceae bacterium]